MQQYLPACKIVTTHGVRGEMKAIPLCDGAKFLSQFQHLYPTAQGGTPEGLTGVRSQGNMLLVTLEDVEDMDAARSRVGRTYYFARAEAKLPKGSYFVDDFIGCEVKDAETGTVYGVITAVEHPAAQDIYTVKAADGQEYLFPAVDEFVDRTDIEGRTVYVRPISGMFGEAVNGDKA